VSSWPGGAAHFLKAYRGDDAPAEHLVAARRSLKDARSALLSSQHGVFDTWYDTDRLFNLNDKIEAIDRLIAR